MSRRPGLCRVSHPAVPRGTDKPLDLDMLGLAVLALSALVLYQAATRTGTGGGHGLAGLVTAALGLLLVGLLGMPGVASDTTALDLRWAPPAGAEPAPPTPEPAPPTEPQPDPGQQPQPGPLHPAEVEASAWAGPSKDGTGSTVTFEAENLVDGLADTAWRVEGDGVGHTLTLRFDRPVHLTAIGLLPGYAKVDQVSGVNRFRQNRGSRPRPTPSTAAARAPSPSPTPPSCSCTR